MNTLPEKWSSKAGQRCLDKWGRWRPNGNMRLFLSVMQKRAYQCTFKSAFREMGAPEHAKIQLCKWRENLAFCEWWEREAAKWIHMHLPKVYGALMRAATVGGVANPAAAKLLFERFDEKYRPRQDVQLKGVVGIVGDENLKRLCDTVVERFAEDAAGERATSEETD